MEEMIAVKAAAYLGAAFVMAVGSMAPAYAQGLIGSKAIENVGKYPEGARDIKGLFFTAMVFVETSAIYCLLISLLLVLRS